MNTPNSIITFTGKYIEPLNPQWGDLEIEDIAHSLSNTCRYSGHCKEFYSVAQHSVYVSYNVHPENALNALLHDGSEAYLGDVPRPIKHTLQYKFYREVEDIMQTMIYQKFGKVTSSVVESDTYESKDIVFSDDMLLYIEQHHLFKINRIVPLRTDFKYKDKFLLDVFKPTSPKESELEFLERYNELKNNG